MLLEESLSVSIMFLPHNQAPPIFFQNVPQCLVGGKLHGVGQTKDSFVEFVIYIHLNLYKTNFVK